MLRAMLFDFDGTIADTEPLHLEAFRRVLAPRGITIGEREYFERYLVGTDRECLERMLDDHARPDLRAQIESLYREKLDAMDRLLSGEVRLFAGTREFLAIAESVGPLGIVTGGVGAQVRRLLRASRLDHLFPVVIAAENVRRGKPDPEGYRAGRARLRDQGLYDLEPGECLAVEDSPTGILAAREAGMRTLALAHSRPTSELTEADRVAAGYLDVDWNDLRSLFE